MNPSLKEKEGFYDNIFDKVEANLVQNEKLPNFLLNILIKRNTDLTINNKENIIARLTELLTDFVLTGRLQENDFVESVHKSRHSGKAISANYGGYLQQYIDADLILRAIKKKEEKVEAYIQNSGATQWLVLVIGSVS